MQRAQIIYKRVGVKQSHGSKVTGAASIFWPVKSKALNIDLSDFPALTDSLVFFLPSSSLRTH